MAALILCRAIVSRINYTGVESPQGERPKVSLKCLAIGNRKVQPWLGPCGARLSTMSISTLLFYISWLGCITDKLDSLGVG